MSNLKKMLILSLSTFSLLILINLGLPAIFLLMRVPSFMLGNNYFWFMEWSNTTSASSIRFNLIFLLAIAVVVGLVGLLLKSRTKH